MLTRIAIALFSLTIAAAACGGDDDGGPLDPTDFCHALIDVVCTRVHECYPEGEAHEDYGANREECIDNLEEAADCDQPTPEVCPGYDPDAARDCVDQYAGLTCDQVTDGFDDTETSACDRICG